MVDIYELWITDWELSKWSLRLTFKAHRLFSSSQSLSPDYRSLHNVSVFVQDGIEARQLHELRKTSNFNQLIKQLSTFPNMPEEGYNVSDELVQLHGLTWRGYNPYTESVQLPAEESAENAQGEAAGGS